MRKTRVEREPCSGVRANNPIHRHPPALLRKIGALVRARQPSDVDLQLRSLVVRAHAVVPRTAELREDRVDTCRRVAEVLAGEHGNDFEQAVPLFRRRVTAVIERNGVDIFDGQFHADCSWVWMDETYLNSAHH